MVNSCSAFGCTARSAKGVSRSFHRFPVNPDKRAAWILATKRKNFVPSSASFICSDHFSKNCFDESKTSGYCLRKYLKPDAIPTIFDFPKHFRTTTSKIRKAPTERMLKEQIKKEKNDTVFENTYEEKVISTNKKMSVEDCMETDSDNLQTVNKKLSFVLNVYKLQKKRIRYVMQQKRRLKKKVAKLQNVINELQEKRLISDEATATLNRLNPGVKDLIQRELKSKSKLKYSPSLRTFALTCIFIQQKHMIMSDSPSILVFLTQTL
ncbi:THAP domain-containing protein 1-like [Hydra vulgaris]|uniref:THAP domain-containing protein 1-like n=1 Tax=Hydra vulgaris TaxID=6087 RepID=A0ABM4CMI9_HYDVU